jgi:hypothetical protein
MNYLYPKTFAKKIFVCLFVLLLSFKNIKSQTVTLLNETFASNSFTTNGWSFPSGQSPWVINTFYTPSGATAPNAIFFPLVSSPVTNYNIPLLSTTINATSVTGPVFFNCLVRLQNSTSNANGNEQLTIEYKTTASSTWTSIVTYSNNVPGLNQNFSVSSFILSGVTGQNFQVRFSAHGVTSLNMSGGWALDNIYIYGVTCPASLPALTIAPTPSICAGASATLTASGGGPSYTWSPEGGNTPTAVVSPTTTTSYALISSYPGCTTSPVSAIVTVTVANNTTTLTVNSSTSTICAGSSVTLTAGGAATYTWNSGGTGTNVVVSPTVTTNYTVTSTNSQGCNNTQTLGINVNPVPVLSVFSSTSVVCPGNLANLIASGASSYSWTHGASGAVIGVTPSTTTTYTVIGTSTAGCSSSATISITVPQPVSLASSNSLICSGASVTLTASGANTYTWSTNANSASIIVSPTVSSSYTVNGTDNAGCISSQTTAININPSPTVTAISSSTNICAGSSVTITANGASTYTWNTGTNGSSVVATPGTNTFYVVAGTSMAGCTGPSANATLMVMVSQPPVLIVNSTSSLICSGKNVTLTASGAGTYTWNFGGSGSTEIIAPTQNTVYTVTGASTLQCTSTATIGVNVIPSPSITIVSSNTALCTGASATLLASGAATYTWSDGSHLNVLYVTPTASGTYSLAGASNGCTDSKSIHIVVNSKPAVNVTASETLVCSGHSILLSANGAFSYSWSTGATGNLVTETPTSGITYTVLGTDTNNCNSTASISIQVKPSPTLTIQPNPSIICSGESSTIIATGAQSYTWSTASNDSIIVVSPATDSSYSVVGSGNNGCTSYASAPIIVSACDGIDQFNSIPITIGIKVFPNPFSDKIHVKLNDEGHFTLRVYNTIGGTIMTVEIEKDELDLDLSALPKGIYYLKAEDGNVHQVTKILKN